MLALCITGFDVDPNVVSNVLGLAPTSVGRRGELGRSGRPRAFNGWWMEHHPAALFGAAQHEAALDALVAQLEGKEENFAELRASVRPRTIEIYGGLDHHDGQCGIWLKPNQMAVLAACGIGWGLEVQFEPDL